MVDLAQLLTQAREQSGLSRAELARRVGTSRSALHDYERGARVPRADGLLRILDATGAVVRVELASVAAVDHVEGLAEVVDRLLPSDAGGSIDAESAWRSIVSDFIANVFVPATSSHRSMLLAVEPPAIGDPRWDSFVGAVAEHLAFYAEIPRPPWTTAEARLRSGPFWWPVHGALPSMRASAMAHSPAPFRRRCINIDGRELPLVTR